MIGSEFQEAVEVPLPFHGSAGCDVGASQIRMHLRVSLELREQLLEHDRSLARPPRLTEEDPEILPRRSIGRIDLEAPEEKRNSSRQ